MSRTDDEAVSNSESEGATQYEDQSTENGSCGNGAETEEFDGDFDYEEGFDVATHGGGGLEAVEGYDALRPLVEGFGDTEDHPLPSDFTSIPMASDIDFETESANFAETVQGEDDRVQITKVGNVPWRMICHLIMTYPDGRRGRGTGWFVSPRTVVTAGHCVHSQKAGGWATSVEVIPGMHGRKRPFGTSNSRTLRSVKGWINGRKPSHDYGAIILPEGQRLGERTGWFSFGNLSDDSLRNLLANNSGYPGDKTFGSQWYNAGRITAVEKRQLHYMLDTYGGQSGSPIWRYSTLTRKRMVVGIHAYGGSSNKSTRITKSVFTNLKNWKSEGI